MYLTPLLYKIGSGYVSCNAKINRYVSANGQ